MSTRASISTDASSLSSALRRANFTTPAMNARLVSSTSPSGTIATPAATVPDSASRQSSLVRHSRHSRISAIGGRATIRNSRMRLTPVRSSECTRENSRAAPANDAA